MGKDSEAPAVVIQSTRAAQQTAIELSRELRNVGVEVRTDEEVIRRFLGTFGVPDISHIIEIHQLIAHAKTVGEVAAALGGTVTAVEKAGALIKKVVKAVKSLAAKKKAQGEPVHARIKIIVSGKDEFIIDFNEQQVVERAFKDDEPNMIIPNATKVTPVEVLATARRPEAKGQPSRRQRKKK